MSAAANIARNSGYEVLGSDNGQIYSPAKEVLRENHISYFNGYNQQNVANSQANLYVLSAGEDLNNPEVKYITDNDLPRMGFAELLFELAKQNLRIVVAGTHGKTTTAGLLGHLVKNLDDSSFMVGGVLQNYGSNFYKGDGHYFVFEGDEYKEEFDDPTPKFHFYKPDILVLTNLEYDHPDQFASLEDLEHEFELLIDAMPEDGLIVYNADNPNLARLVHKSNVTSVSFGVDNEADFKADSVDFEGEITTIRVTNKFSAELLAKLLEKTEDYKIQLPGKINVYNALAAIATLRILGFSRENLVLDLLSYKGIKRRFEVVGVKNGITIVDDYAHHSTAVRETLEAARLKYFKGDRVEGKRGNLAPNDNLPNPQPSTLNPKLWAIFEPHTFSRTKATLPELAKSFAVADEVLISEIYPAREKASEATVKSDDVVAAIKAYNTKYKIQNTVRKVGNKNEALDILKSECHSGDVIIVMAVGAFNRLAYELKEIL